ncbi:MAG: endonuclease/exonuclease/phosphatase family protein [Thermoanaerobaculia bacterium]
MRSRTLFLVLLLVSFAASAVEIPVIQGTGDTSPLVGQTIQTDDNIVTAVGLKGFFIQTPDARTVPGSRASNGIYVFMNSLPPVNVGDQVDVSGRIDEYFNFTEIAGTVTVTVDAHDQPLPSVRELQPGFSDFEPLEGTLVRIVNGLATGGTDKFYATPVVAGQVRPFREPGASWDRNPEVIEIDPTALATMPMAVPSIVGGASIALAEGPLGYAFGDYQIWATRLDVSNPSYPRAVRARRAGEMTIATQNLLRLFDDRDDPSWGDPKVTAADYSHRLGKLSTLLRSLLGSPDIVVVQEVENEQALDDVAKKLASDEGALRYTAHSREGNDTSGIDVGFLVRDTVRIDSIDQYGKDLRWTTPSGSSQTVFDRPPLVLRGAYIGNGSPFPIVVMAIHMRSLIGVDDPADGPFARAKRHEQGLRISQYIQSIQTASPGTRIVVAGDFNAHEFSDGYVDVMGQITGRPDPAGAMVAATDEVDPDLTNQIVRLPASQRYSYVYEGNAQALDHILTSAALEPFVRDLQYARVNADAPESFATRTDALRLSDHDPAVLFVMTDKDADGRPDDAAGATSGPRRRSVKH